MATEKPTTDTTPPGPAEPGAGTPPPSFAAAIDAEYGHMIRIDHPAVVSYGGVPAFAPGDRVPASHPALASLIEQGVAVPYVPPGEG